MRVRFNPLALLLDASLEGEYDLVQRIIYEVRRWRGGDEEPSESAHLHYQWCFYQLIMKGERRDGSVMSVWGVWAGGGPQHAQ